MYLIESFPDFGVDHISLRLGFNDVQRVAHELHQVGRFRATFEESVFATRQLATQIDNSPVVFDITPGTALVNRRQVR